MLDLQFGDLLSMLLLMLIKHRQTPEDEDEISPHPEEGATVGGLWLPYEFSKLRRFRLCPLPLTALTEEHQAGGLPLQ